jgi:D-glycero-D-manno-heptose 1,7-bisphosphate phosphatase
MRIENLILDRDGTIIEERHYLSDPAGVALIPGAGEALAALCRAGVRLFVASNQSGIGRGYYCEADYHAVHARMCELLAQAGVSLCDAAFCPHAPQEDCACRKPATGMWDLLSGEHGLEPATTAMVGDKTADVRFGRRTGLALSLLVLTGHGREHAELLDVPQPAAGCLALPSPGPDQPHAVCADLAAAVAFILDYNQRQPA